MDSEGFGFGESSADEQWAPMSDLMAALMLIFMFVAIIFVRTVVDARSVQREECETMHRILAVEFGQDFEDWDVELLKDLTIRFRNPEILFAQGRDVVSPRFREILEDFFPRYVKILRSKKFLREVREVRIEGHTSSEWNGSTSDMEGYFKNMELSQDRTRAILHLVLQSEVAHEDSQWLRPLITANGLSSSKPILDRNNDEDRQRSRRVEFRLMTSACQMAGIDSDD